jgi:hypothetical protein
MAMLIPRFFRQAKPRTFNYRPVFYDRKKEILNRRIREGLKGDIFVPSIRKGSFREFHFMKHRDLRKKSNIRFLVILVFLALVILIFILL